MAVTCDTVKVLSIPPANGVDIILDGITLVPTPFVNIVQEKYTNGNQVVGGVWKITLNGVIVKDNYDDVTAEVRQLLEAFSESDCINIKITKCGGEAKDPPSKPSFIWGEGRILSISFDQGNQPTWVNLAPYTIEIELYTNNQDDSSAPVFFPVVVPSTGVVPKECLLSEYDESFSISVNEDAFNWDEVLGASPASSPDLTSIGNQHISVSFTITATGISGNGCTPSTGSPSNYYYGLDAAERAILNRIDDIRSLDIPTLTESIDDPTNTGYTIAETLPNVYNGGIRLMEFRSININAVKQSIEVSGEFILRPSGCKHPNLFTTVSVGESVDGDGRTVTISGDLKAVIDTSFDVDKLIKYNKFNCNITPLSSTDSTKRMDVINNFLYDLSNNLTLLQNIANHPKHRTRTYFADTCVYNDICVSGSPAPSPVFCDLRVTSSQFQRDYGQGTGSFSFVLTNTGNCGVIGARKVDVDITHEKPVDNIVEIIVPGRGDKGVLIQNICCKTSEKYSIRVNATLNSNLCGYNNTLFDSMSVEFQKCICNLLSDLEQKGGVDARCWFLVENTESFGNTSYSLSRQYVRPSCP